MNMQDDDVAGGGCLAVGSVKTVARKMHRRREVLGFEKNYPKNIFIPMIEHLAELGYKDKYEGEVGTRQEFQAKNVVSLEIIHTLLSQPWFKSCINRQKLLKSVSNKILFNSKIKRKLFHLRVFEKMMDIPLEDAKIFRKQLSLCANQVAKLQESYHELFGYSSATHYLLLIFYQGLAGLVRNDKNRALLQAKVRQIKKKTESSIFGSKEDYKLILKQLSFLLSLKCLKGKILTNSIFKIEDEIDKKEGQIRELYQFQEGIPSWKIFISEFVQKCLNKKKCRRSITCSMLNTWLHEFRQKVSEINISKQDKLLKFTMESNIRMINQEGEQQDIPQRQEIEEEPQENRQQKFTPIVLITPRKKSENI